MRAAEVTVDALPAILEFCRSNEARLLIARCLTSELSAVQAMEREGFLLMDTLVYYERDLLKTPIPPDQGRIPIRTFRPGEEDAVRAVAASAFRGYFGHYHADSRLDRHRSDEAYADWAQRSCLSGEAADEVLVADCDGKPVGFTTLRMNSPTEGEGVLVAVAPEAQGRGVCVSFMVHAMKWCLSRGASTMIISTQLTNLSAQKAWVRVGFRPVQSYYTFHKWFDNLGC